jgi:hypothetical protein
MALRYAGRFVSVTWIGLALIHGVPAASEARWPVVVDSFTMILVSVVLWFAMPPGAQWLQVPAVGTRSLRVGVYAALLALAALMMFPSLFGEHACRNTLTPLIAAILAVTLLRAEGPAPVREGGARA